MLAKQPPGYFSYQVYTKATIDTFRYLASKTISSIDDWEPWYLGAPITFSK